MATNKPGALKLSNRATATSELTSLIHNIVPASSNVVQAAVDKLLEAADDYIASQPIADPTGRRGKPKLAQARASLVILHKYLSKAQEQMAALCAV
jgi:hypothetical protein